LIWSFPKSTRSFPDGSEERERERECEREMPHYVRFKCRSEQLVRIYQISFSLFSTMADTAVLPAPAPARPARRAPATPNNGISRHIEALKMEEKALKARKIIINKEKRTLVGGSRQQRKPPND
jgi:hypothetical protein